MIISSNIPDNIKAYDSSSLSPYVPVYPSASFETLNLSSTPKINLTTSQQKNVGAEFLWTLYFTNFVRIKPNQWEDPNTKRNLQNYFKETIKEFYTSLPTLYDPQLYGTNVNQPLSTTQSPPTRTINNRPRPSNSSYNTYRLWLTGGGNFGDDTWFNEASEDLAASFNFFMQIKSNQRVKGNSPLMYSYSLLLAMLVEIQEIMIYQSQRIKSIQLAQQKSVSGINRFNNKIQAPTSSENKTAVTANQNYQLKMGQYQALSDLYSSYSSNITGAINSGQEATTQQRQLMNNIITQLKSFISGLFR